MYKYTIKCLGCSWSKPTNGTKEEVKDLIELPNNCASCGKPRQFRCPKCSKIAKMRRL